MTVEMSLAILALLISGLAALYSRWSAREARKANDIGRLNALLALRSHYLALMDHQARLADTLRGLPSGLIAAQKAYTDLDGKLREVSHEIDAYHISLVGVRT
jgi:hypothetical protein